MTVLKPFYLVIVIFCLVSCAETPSADVPLETDIPQAKLSKSQVIIQETIEAHGGDLYNSAHYSFVFRGNTYAFNNSESGYQYSKTTQKGDSIIVDIVVNGTLTRTLNGDSVKLTEKQEFSIKEAINSVVYFATLPHKLSDEAVNSQFIDSVEIKGKTYQAIKVAFSQEGGGEDFEDEYYYWINSETKKVDYFAYNYQVNGGGVRFRSAYNTRVVDGIIFQDYINYKAEVGTPLKELPRLFEADKLIEVSRIDTEEVVRLGSK